MATQELTGALSSADHGDTSPLPPAAAAALDRIDRAFLPLEIVRAVTVYEVASARYDELVARPASTLSPAEFDACLSAQQRLAEAFGVLAEAGRLDLIKDPVAAAAAVYRKSESRANELIGIGRTGCMSDLDADDLAHHVDLMAGARATLAEAGRLDLIGGA